LAQFYFNGLNKDGDFVEKSINLAKSQLQEGKLSKEERWLSLWILGLTEKASQNVLRDSSDALDAYTTKYDEVCKEVINDAVNNYGNLTGNLSIGELDVTLNWNTLASLLNTSGT